MPSYAQAIIRARFTLTSASTSPAPGGDAVRTSILVRLVRVASGAEVVSPCSGTRGAIVWIEISDRDDLRSLRGADPDREIATLVLANDLVLVAAADAGADVTILCPRHALAVRAPLLADMNEDARSSLISPLTDAAAASPEIVPMLARVARGARLRFREIVIAVGDSAILHAHLSRVEPARADESLTLLARGDRGDVTIEPICR